MNDCLIQYYRCPERYLSFAKKESMAVDNDYFQFGPNVTCYGSHCVGDNAIPGSTRYDALGDVEFKKGTIYLPFDPSQVVDNLRSERYVTDWWAEKPVSVLAKMYYLIRPSLPVSIRRHLQKLYLRGWERIPFPRWPVDSSVDDLLGQLLLQTIQLSQVQRIPFIWFWPNAAPGCAIMTHDVETQAGMEFCRSLMDIDDSFGIKASFQVIPEERYCVEQQFLSSINDRAFEVVVHDLNHDGHLYKTYEQFLERCVKINAYSKKYGADGFRAGVLYRKQLWYDALDFAYDMSVPNVAHLDPQRGGCCTVMPYFIGNILELPVTTTQDYSLFNILNEYSTLLWQRQIKIIMEKHGLMSFIVHPDYITSPRERDVYESLLADLSNLRDKKGIWIALPREVNRWWRQRAAMRLIEDEVGWHIEGEGSDRARIAYASEENGRLVFTLQDGPVTRELVYRANIPTQT